MVEMAFNGEIKIMVRSGGVGLEVSGGLDTTVVALCCLKVAQRLLEDAVKEAAGNDKLLNVVRGNIIH